MTCGSIGLLPHAMAGFTPSLMTRISAPPARIPVS
jgi:hypothetical protein